MRNGEIGFLRKLAECEDVGSRSFFRGPYTAMPNRLIKAVRSYGSVTDVDLIMRAKEYLADRISIRAQERAREFVDANRITDGIARVAAEKAIATIDVAQAREDVLRQLSEMDFRAFAGNVYNFMAGKPIDRKAVG